MILAFLFTITAFAGHEVGNGGHGVECAGQKLRLLDYVEHAVPVEKPQPYQEQVAKILDELAKVDARMAVTLKRRWEKWPEVSETSEEKLTLIKDSAHSSVPQGCKLVQIAIRRHKPLGEQKTFVLQKTFWDSLGETHKAGVALHELVYEHFYYLGERDSRTTRRYNAYIGQLVDRAGVVSEYQQMVRGLKIPLYR